VYRGRAVHDRWKNTTHMQMDVRCRFQVMHSEGLAENSSNYVAPCHGSTHGSTKLGASKLRRSRRDSNNVFCSKRLLYLKQLYLGQIEDVMSGTDDGGSQAAEQRDVETLHHIGSGLH
jgi:hypothetical protein